MALVVTVDSVDITAYVEVGSIVVEQVASDLVATCRFRARDATGTIAIDPEDSITIVEGGTTFFAGKVKDAWDDVVGITKVWEVVCTDYNVLLEETAITSYTIDTNDDDDVEIAAIFSAYRSDIDATTYVTQLDTTMPGLVLDGFTIREAMDEICAHTGGRYYVDFSMNLHYFSAEANAAAFSLSDSPDGANSFGYRNFRRLRSSARKATRFWVQGDGVADWVTGGSYSASDPEGVSRDNRITTSAGVTKRGTQLLDRYEADRVTYELNTTKDGLQAGMDVTVVNSLWSVNSSLTIRKVQLRILDRAGDVRLYHLVLNDELPSAARARQQIGRQIGTLQQSVNDLDDEVFDDDSPAAPTFVLGNLSTGITEDVDGHQSAWIRATWGLVNDADLDHYEIQCADNTSFNWPIIFHVQAGDTREVTFSGLIANTTYYLRVRAVDWVGNYSAWSPAAPGYLTLTTSHDTTPPGNPTNVTAVATPVSVHVSWDANSEADLAHYEIQRKPDGGGYSALATVKINFFIDITVSIGTDYWYQVRAVDRSGNASGWVETAGAVGPNVIGEVQLPIASQGWVHDLVFSATDHNTMAWSSGTITCADGTTTFSISAGNTGNMTAVTYVYLDTDTSTTVLQTSTTATDAVGGNKILIAVAEDVASGRNARFVVFGGDGAGTPLIVADNIAADAITANEIAANTITAAEIAADTITATQIAAGTITATEIQALAIGTGQLAAGAVTAAKITANTITANEIAAGTITAAEIATGTITATEITGSTLSAIYANMGTLTAGEIRIGTGTPGVNFTGFRIMSSYLAGYNNDTLQAGIRVSDGLFIAAAGDVIISENGIYIVAATSYNRKNSITFRNAGDTEEYLRLYAIATAGGNDVWLYSNAGTNRSATIYINAVSAGTGESMVRIYSSDVGGTCNLYVLTGRVSVDKNFFINDSVNTKMTLGMTINQGANDNEIFALKSSDVAHGMTTNAETDTWFHITKEEGTSGGASLYGYKDAGGSALAALNLYGRLGEAVITTKSTGGWGIVNLVAQVRSGTTVTAPGADGNMVSIASSGSVRFIFDQEGEMHSDAIIGVGNDWDEWDDLALAADLSRLPRAKYDEMLRYQAEDFERAGLVTLSVDGEGRRHAFIRHKAMLLFAMNCFREVHQRMQRYEQVLLNLGVSPTMLGIGD